MTKMQEFLGMLEAHDSDACLIWPYANTQGYGIIQNRPHRYRVHHLSWIITHKMDVPKDRFVLHRCDTPACFNPRHLFLGSNADNSHDMWAKGRGRVHPPMRGSENPRAKLTETQVLLIRDLRARGFKLKDIAELVGAKVAITSHIANRRVWRHL